jgi:hypothetical protein
MSNLSLGNSRKLTKDQKLAEGQKLSRAYKQWQREQLDAALASAHGATVAELMNLLDRLELHSAATLLACVQHTDWSAVSYDVRFTVLHQINETISRLRERNGMAPFDDGLPSQPDNAFRRIKQILFPPSSARKRRHLSSEVATQSVPGRDVTATALTKGVNDDE